MVGGQIWGNWSEKANTYSATDAVPDPNNKRCFVANLRKGGRYESNRRICRTDRSGKRSEF